MANRESMEILELLQRIDDGYEPTKQEKDELARVTELDLRGNTITELPESIGSLSALQVLNLGSTQITELPESIGTLS